MVTPFFSRFTKTGRRLKRQTSAMEKAQQKAQLADIESEIGFRELEDPREQAQLRQSLFGRGMGKSSIATQNQARLTDIQARRRAVLARQKDLAHRGLSLIKLRARAAKRNYTGDLAEMWGVAMGGYSAGKGLGGGGGGADESGWVEV